ncbi:MAG: hypothetical protein DI568_08910 [Sphingomonas sp.]|nr:MAG: hypothetical protein DI568_08910 [Sphingomonas sp.]
MSMMGGAAGKVGGILTGPWGAAITMGAVGLGVLITALQGGEEAMKAQEAAAESHKKAIEALDAATGRMSRTQEEAIRVGVAAAQADLNAAIAARQRAQAEMEKAKAFMRSQDAMSVGSGGDPGARGAYAGGLVAGVARLSDLEADIAASKAAEATARAQLANANYATTLARVKGQLDPVVKATQDYEREQTRLRASFEKGQISESQLTAGLLKAERDLSAAREAAQASDKAAGAAAREAKKAAADAAREAKRAAEEQARLIEKILDSALKARLELDKLARGDGSYVGFLGALNAADKAREAATQKSREETGLAGAVSRAEDEWRAQQDAAKEAARKAAEELRQKLVGYAGTIGSLIGEGAAYTMQELTDAIFTGKTDQLFGNGPLTTVGRTLIEASKTDEFKEAFRPVVKQLKDVFGDTPFADQIGGVFQSVAFGSAVAEIVGKGAKEERIGAAVGTQAGKAAEAMGWLPPGVGQAIGAALGAAVGGLFVGSKTGSVTLTGSNGQMVQGDATGSGGTQVKNADILGNNFTNALSSIIETLGGSVGNYSVSLGQNGKYYRVDTTGQGRTSKRQSGVLAFGEDANAAVQATLADAIRDGAVAGVSPRVQAVLNQYADNLDKAVSEALKVQGLENFLADRENPFASAFRDFERQAAERLRIARAYGFNVVEIERINAEERTKLIKEQAEEQLASVRALLDDLRFGSRAEGSVSDQLAALSAERSRLQGLVDGGDVSQIDALADIIQQQIDLSRSAYGSTGQYAADRSDAITTLEQLMRQTEERVQAASSAAQNLTNDKLSELNATADEQMTEAQRQTALLAQIAAQLSSGGGYDGSLLGLYARALV